MSDQIYTPGLKLKDNEAYQRMKANMRAMIGTGELEEIVKQIKAGRKHNCPVCMDVGFIRHEAANTADPLFGQVYPCPDCQTGRASLSDCGLMSDDLQRLSWEDVAPLPINQAGIDKAIGAIKNVMAQGHGWVYLYGTPGLGKSLFLEIAVAISMRSGQQAYFTSMVDMMDDLRASFDPQQRDESLRQKVARWTNAPLLAIDEFEKVNGSGFTDERRFQILNERYRRAVAGTPTGITLMAGNVGPDMIDEPALVSRIKDERFAVVKLTGMDVRSIAGSL